MLKYWLRCVHTAIANPCGTLICTVCLLLQLSNPDCTPFSLPAYPVFMEVCLIQKPLLVLLPLLAPRGAAERAQPPLPFFPRAPFLLKQGPSRNEQRLPVPYQFGRDKAMSVSEAPHNSLVQVHATIENMKFLNAISLQSCLIINCLYFYAKLVSR